jgi:hypothetical protein
MQTSPFAPRAERKTTSAFFMTRSKKYVFRFIKNAAMAAQVPPPAMTAIEFMGLGLEIGGHTRWRTYKHEANIKRFKEAYGVIPESCVLLWDALRNSMDPTIRLLKNGRLLGRPIGRGRTFTTFHFVRLLTSEPVSFDEVTRPKF